MAQATAKKPGVRRKDMQPEEEVVEFAAVLDPASRAKFIGLTLPEHGMQRCRVDWGTIRQSGGGKPSKGRKVFCFDPDCDFGGAINIGALVNHVIKKHPDVCALPPCIPSPARIRPRPSCVGRRMLTDAMQLRVRPRRCAGIPRADTCPFRPRRGSPTRRDATLSRARPLVAVAGTRQPRA